MTLGHVSGWFVNSMVSITFEYWSSQTLLGAAASFFVGLNNFEMTYLTSRT